MTIKYIDYTVCNMSKFLLKNILYQPSIVAIWTSVFGKYDRI